jgi:two-component system nitrogen regulation sensor histidine kinase GlnL
MNVGPLSPGFFLLLALFSIALAGLVFLKARPGPLRNYFSLFATSVAIWLASGFLLYSAIDPPRAVLWARLAFAAGAILILSLYHVLVLFPDFSSARFSRLINLAGATFAVLAVASPLLAREVISNGPFQIDVVYGPLFLPFTAYTLTVVVLGAHALTTRFRIASGLRKLQIQYLLLGTAIPVAGVLVTNLILPLAFEISTFAPYGRLLALVFLPVTAHAIMRHRLMDIKLFVRKAVVYSCAVAAGAGIFAGLLGLIALVGPSTRGKSVQESILLALLIAVVFQPVKNWIEVAFNRYLYRERHDYPKTLKDSSQRLSATLDSHATTLYLTELVSGMFKAEPVAVYLRDDSREAFVPTAQKDPLNVGRIAPIATKDPLPFYLEKHRRVLVRDEVPDKPQEQNVDAATAQLRSLGGDIAISFWHLGRLWGFLVVGAKLSGDPYFSEDVDFLLTLGSQTAVAIENLQLHRQMEDERLRAERLGVIGTLASGIAHEIKNPLVAIRTFAELLPERYRDEEFHGEFSKVVIREIGRIDGLVARLRELATQPVQRLTTLDLCTPLTETLALLRGQLEQKNIRVETRYQADAPPILGEVDLLKQLFLNLCINATEAMDPGGQLTIRLWSRRSVGNDRVIVDIADTGCGIPNTIAGQIFDPFFSTKPGGSGLGLAICRSIADAHGATIRAQSNPAAKGATFTIEFPLGRKPPAKDALEFHERNGLRGTTA